MPGTAQLRSKNFILHHPIPSIPISSSVCFIQGLQCCCCIGFICMTCLQRRHNTLPRPWNKIEPQNASVHRGCHQVQRGGSWMIWIAEHRSLEIKERHQGATPWPPCFRMLWWFTKVFGPWSLVNFWNLLSLALKSASFELQPALCEMYISSSARKADSAGAQMHQKRDHMCASMRKFG